MPISPALSLETEQLWNNEGSTHPCNKLEKFPQRLELEQVLFNRKVVDKQMHGSVECCFCCDRFYNEWLKTCIEKNLVPKMAFASICVAFSFVLCFASLSFFALLSCFDCFDVVLFGTIHSIALPFFCFSTSHMHLVSLSCTSLCKLHLCELYC